MEKLFSKITAKMRSARIYNVTGFFLVVNFLVFIFATIYSQAIFLPSAYDLWILGAKESGAIAEGEWWRLISAVFLHVGIIHFLINSFALRAIGHYIEAITGKYWFIAIYILTGIYGYICSSYFNIHISAGASGSIFGLVGVGLMLEVLLYSREKREKASFLQHWFRFRGGPFALMTLFNFALALFLNLLFSLFGLKIGIDNAAHSGGLLLGCILCYIMLHFKENRLLKRNLFKGLLAVFACSLLFYFSLSVVSDKPTMARVFYREALHLQEMEHRSIFLQRAIELDPNKGYYYLELGKIYFALGKPKEGLRAFYYSLKKGTSGEVFEKFHDKLKKENQMNDAALMEAFIMNYLPVDS